MRILGNLVLALLVALSLAFTLPACGIDNPLDDDEPGDPSPDDIVQAALAPKPARTYEAIGQGVICPGSYRTFTRTVENSTTRPPAGTQWHHIVNQNDTNVERFGNRLHCTDNLIALPKEIHQRVSGHYTTKPDWTKGEFVRDVINKRSWTEQYEYGLDVLRQNGVEP